MKHSNFSLGIILLSLLAYHCYPMMQESAKDTSADKQTSILEQLPLKELDTAYGLAQKAQKTWRSINYQMLAGEDLSSDDRQKVDIFVPQCNEKATQELKSFLYTYQGNDILKHLSGFVFRGADINLPLETSYYNPNMVPEMSLMTAMVIGGSVLGMLPLATLGAALMPLMYAVRIKMDIKTSSKIHFNGLLSIGMLNKHYKLVEYLLAHGADCNKPLHDYGYKRNFPLDKALEDRDLKMIRCLLGWGASIDAQSFVAALAHKESFVLLCATWLFRHAAGEKVTEQKDFEEIKKSIIALIAACKPEEQKLFIQLLNDNIIDITHYFEAMNAYLDSSLNLIIALYRLKQYTAQNLCTRKILSLEQQEELLHKVVDMTEADSFVFDCARATKLLALLFDQKLSFLGDQRHRKQFLVHVQFLLAQGACVDAAFGQGKTPLYYAIREWQDDVVQLLLEHGAHPDMFNWYEIRPLQSVDFYKPEPAAHIVKHLLKSGVDVYLTDNQDRGVLELLDKYPESMAMAFRYALVTARWEKQGVASMMKIINLCNKSCKSKQTFSLIKQIIEKFAALKWNRTLKGLVQPRTVSSELDPAQMLAVPALHKDMLPIISSFLVYETVTKKFKQF